MTVDPLVQLHLDAFRKVFRLTEEHAFGRDHEGIDDHNDGVQWNAWVGRSDDWPVTGFVGVNLEGKEYDDWPVARLIERELATLSLFKVAATINWREGITVRWSRDAWVAGGNRLVTFPENLILNVRLSDLSEGEWRGALVEAQGCLNRANGYRGRARQAITTREGVRELGVSPHLQFMSVLWYGHPPAPAALVERMQGVQARLLPLHCEAIRMAV